MVSLSESSGVATGKPVVLMADLSLLLIDTMARGCMSALIR